MGDTPSCQRRGDRHPFAEYTLTSPQSYTSLVILQAISKSLKLSLIISEIKNIISEIKNLISENKGE